MFSRPLHDLLKKGGFQWSEKAQTAFMQLKEALVSATILAVLDFRKTFIVEIDASNEGIGAVLMQQGRPLAYLRKALRPRWQRLSVYEKELLALVHAV